MVEPVPTQLEAPVDQPDRRARVVDEVQAVATTEVVEAFARDELLDRARGNVLRPTLGLFGGALAVGIVGSAPASAFPPVTRDDVEWWESSPDEHARRLGRRGSLDMLPTVTARLDDVHRRMPAGDLRGPALRTAALLSGLIAISFVDLGHPREATRHWTATLRAAPTIG